MVVGFLPVLEEIPDRIKDRHLHDLPDMGKLILPEAIQALKMRGTAPAATTPTEG